MSWFDQKGDSEFEKNVGYSRGLASSHDGTKKAKGLNELVKKHLKYVQEEVPRRATRSDGFHASSLGAMCKRHETFKRLLPRAADAKKFDAELLLRFQIGHAVHHHWQNKVLGPAGILKGTWVCSRCTRKIKNSFMPTEPCAKCEWQMDPVRHRPQPRSAKSVDCITGCIWPGGFKAAGRDCRQCERGGSWGFQESGITIPDPTGGDDHIVGSYDGILFYDPMGDGIPTDHIGEFKTKDVRAWAYLEAPEYKHVVQVNVYMLQPDMPQRAVIGYIDKNSGLMKEYVCEPDEQIIKAINADTELVRQCVSDEELPNGVCTGCRDSRAKSCPYADVCFLGVDKMNEIRKHMEEAA